MELELFNTVSDYVVPIYLILAIIVIVLFNKQKAAATASTNPDRIYKFTKVDKNASATWQQQMTGTWEKLERRNFYEFMLFNGAPSFVASMKKDSAFGQIIEFQENGKICRVTATGTPSGAGPWGEIASTPADAKGYEGKDMGGRAYIQTNWYVEETKTYTSQFKFVVEGNTLLQTRTMTPEGRLFLRAEMTKPDGRMEYFDTTFKKV